MRSSTRFLLASQLLGAAVGLPSGASTVDTRAEAKTYDYVIVGGGLTGLIVANRLTEDKSKSVLVIEAGGADDNVNIRMPYGATLALNETLLWGYKSEPEPALGNTQWNVRVAKILGGGSVVNGMVYDRGAAADYDAWEALGNRGWGWKGMLPFFKKGTKYIPVSEKTAKDFNITYDPNAYGDGPLAVGVPDFQYPDINDYFAAFEGAGAHRPLDGNNGEAYGASWYPQTFDPRTGERTHVRNAYYDPITSRQNLEVKLQTMADELEFQTWGSGLKASGVKITNKVTGEKQTVYARKEVVLAAGAVNTVKLLQLSGIGPRSVLEAAGIKVRLAHDGVGANFQDHPYTLMTFSISNMSNPNPTSLTTDPAFNASAWNEYAVNKTGPLTQARGNGLAFIPLPQVAPEKYLDLASQVRNQKNAEYLPPIYKNNWRLLAGVREQRRVLANLFTSDKAAVLEVPVPASGAGVLVGLQKPLSRGFISIDPKNPQGAPKILYNALSNPVDKSILASCVRYIRGVWSRPELAKFAPKELSPGAELVTDEELIDAMVSKGAIWPTLAHPSGSCAMMPQQLGGCVSDQLLFYGVNHLSIVDASILPLVPSQHIQSTMYAVGEKAAHIIARRG